MFTKSLAEDNLESTCSNSLPTARWQEAVDTLYYSLVPTHKRTQDSASKALVGVLQIPDQSLHTVPDDTFCSLSTQNQTALKLHSNIDKLLFGPSAFNCVALTQNWPRRVMRISETASFGFANKEVQIVAKYQKPHLLGSQKEREQSLQNSANSVFGFALPQKKVTSK